MPSHYGEHEIIIPFFRGVNNNDLNFLDIGANDGVYISNTWDLGLLGWGGCCIEPSKKAFSALSKNYENNKKVHLFNYGISNYDGILKFYESGNWAGRDDVPSSLLGSLYESHKNGFYGIEWEETECKFTTFEKFIGESPIKIFDFISIDVERHDYIVLSQIDLLKVGCKLICIEHAGDNNKIELYRSYCKKYGMLEIHRTVDNILFSIGGITSWS